jgi:hypothetical protein
LVLIYATVRYGLGIVGLFLVGGSYTALLGFLTILLQIIYELIKLLKIPGRGYYAFCIVSVGYGVRTLSGLAAVEEGILYTSLAATTFVWAANNGALYLCIYWYREGMYYVKNGRIGIEVLHRYKPGVATLYSKSHRGSKREGNSISDYFLIITLIMVPIVALADPSYKVADACILLLVSSLLTLTVTLIKRGAANIFNAIWRRLTIIILAVSAIASLFYAVFTNTVALIPFSMCVMASINYLLMHDIPDMTLWGKGSEVLCRS